MAMLRRLFFFCFPSEGSLQEPGVDSIVTNAVLSAQEQSREFVNHAGTAAASASVRDEAAAELQGAKTEISDLPDPDVTNASGASSPASASKTAPGTPPLDTQGFSDSPDKFDQTHAIPEGVSGTGSGPVGDAQSWAEVAAAGMTSFTSESHNILDKVEQKEAVMGEAAAHAAVSTKDSATHALHEAEASAAAAYSVVDNMRSSVADVVSSKGGDAAAAAQSSGTGKLQQSKESATAAITAVKSAGAAAADTVADADTKVTTAAKSTEERGTTAAEEALTQVGVASAALRSEVIKAKATLAPVVAPDMAPETSQSAGEDTADAGGSDQSAGDTPGVVDPAAAAGAGGAATKPKKKSAKKKNSKKKGKNNKSK